MKEETAVELEPFMSSPSDVYDLVIIGAGPGGMSAALCAGRAQLKTLIIEKALPGGQAATSYKVYNYLGFPSGILGNDLTAQMEKHLDEYDIDITCETVEEVMDPAEPIKTIKTDLGHTYKTKSIIVAVGLEPKRLNEEFDQKFLGRGLSYFAQCDVDSYRDQDVAVIGGGNCACYAAEYLSRFVNKVYVVHRSDHLRAVKRLKSKVMTYPNIDIMWDSDVLEVFGIDRIEKIKVGHVVTGQHTWIDVKAMFVYVGRIPPDSIADLEMKRDEGGFVVTDDYMRTSINGIYAVGDVRSKQIRQIATAVSDGMIAAINVERDLFR